LEKSVDWVRARAKCSLQAVFALLRESVDSDIKTFNEVQPADNPVVLNSQRGKMIVARMGPTGIGENIVFELERSHITVRRGLEAVLFTAKPRLDDNGDCILDVNDQPLQLWQVSRKALEDFFFG
jgi:hypothetical protein